MNYRRYIGVTGGRCRRAALLLGVGVSLLLLAPVARATLAIQPGSFTVALGTAQAGAHADLTTSFAFVTDGNGRTGGNLRDVAVDLPPGFVGYPSAMPTCTAAELMQRACPLDSQVGFTTLELNPQGSAISVGIPVYNIAPEPGQTAVLGFNFSGIVVSNIVISVRPGDYGLSADLSNISGAVEVDDESLTLWGVPADPSHDALRGAECFFGSCSGGERSAGTNRVAFLSNPTRCTSTPLTAGLRVDSWQEPDQPATATANVGPIGGCEHLAFDPSLSLEPISPQADSPSEYLMDLTVAQNSDPEGLAAAELRKAVFRLPQGVALSPAAGDGLQACSDAQFGIGRSEPPIACPPASKIGEATLTTPALRDSLSGALYLAGPEFAPITGPPYRVFLALAGDGVQVKVGGEVNPDPVTGQLTVTFDEDPQLPFSSLRLKLKGGPRAALANPQTCGEATTISELTPWSSPESGAPAEPSSSFTVTGCRTPMPFRPSLTAGTTMPTAGDFSPFTLTLSRYDGEQDLSGLIVQTPPGLLGMLSKAQPCPEPQASNGVCGPESRIGHAEVATGAGSHPFWVAGNVFLTGPYKGAPFGLSVVVPAIAGPFNFGNVIIRAAIFVDSHDSHLTVISDPLPQIIGGVPLRVQTVNVTIDKPGFMFNPTNCSQLQIAATITAAQGASASAVSPFAVTGCKGLPFKPGFTVSTQAKTSKADGASLNVKLTQKPGEANIHRVDLQLPLALPSRLTTLQKACSEAQFNANPGGCPAGSVIGTATARSPVLQVPLTGPAYLVSHAAAAFPDVVFVLQGDERGGVIRIDVVGNTDIKKGITYSRFESVPDTPISSFGTTLPEGPHSALAANGDLCAQSLVIPTTLVGQNGAQVKRNTKISVTGCKGVTITKRRLSGKHVVLSLFLTTRGTMTVTGRGLKRYRRRMSAGSHQIKVALSKAGLFKRRHHRRIKIKVALRRGTKTSSTATSLKL